MQNSTPEAKVIDYFSSLESRLTYFVLKGIKHFGYYPEGQENITIPDAQRKMVSRIFEKLNLKSGSFLLDAGCGEGDTSIFLAGKYGIRAEGVDLLDFSINKANNKLVHSGLAKKVNFRVMDYSNLDFPDETFDAVLALETLVHASDYNRVFKEFLRVLKPGGKLGLLEYTMPSFDTLPDKTKDLLRMIICKSGMHSWPYFLHGQFPKILRNAGFSDVTVEDVTRRVIPMFKKSYIFLRYPYWLIKLFNLQEKFVNITSAVEGYCNLIPNDLWRDNIITAAKV